MESDLSFRLTVIALLICAVYFAVTETAISSVSKNRIRAAAERGDRRAEKVLYVLEHFDDAITTVLIGTNIVHISMASVVTVYVTGKYGLSAVTVSTILTTLVLFFFGEMLPKCIAKKNSEVFSRGCAGVLRVLMRLFRPLSRGLAWLGRKVSSLVSDEPEVSITQEELHDMIDDLAEDGILDADQGSLLNSAMVFGREKACEIMVPVDRAEMVDLAQPVQEQLRILRNCEYSRLPVCRGDHRNIVGMIRRRRVMMTGLEQKDSLRPESLVESVYQASQDSELDTLLEEMSAHKCTLAVLTDEKGLCTGILTVEDILEELVGEIYDEDEKPEETDGSRVREDGTAACAGSVAGKEGAV